MATKTWIIYKTDRLSAPGWEDRKLQPSGALTSILAEEHDYSGVMPQVGDRVREDTNLAKPGNGVTHGKDGDWIVTEIEMFSKPNASFQVLVCVCQFQPIDRPWEMIRRGEPIDESVLTDTVKQD